MVGFEPLHHRLKILIINGQISGMLLNSGLALVNEHGASARRRHIEEKEFATSSAVDSLHQRSKPCDQRRGERVGIGVIECIADAKLNSEYGTYFQTSSRDNYSLIPIQNPNTEFSADQGAEAGLLLYVWSKMSTWETRSTSVDP